MDDAELGINVVDLGLIYRVTVNGGEARITMSPTTPFCPYLPKMIKDIETGKEPVFKADSVEELFDHLYGRKRPVRTKVSQKLQ